jgi:hypothetical protein
MSNAARLARSASSALSIDTGQSLKTNANSRTFVNFGGASFRYRRHPVVLDHALKLEG